VEVRLDTPAVAPGDEARGAVLVHAGEGRATRGGVVGLGCEEEVEVRVRRRTGKHVRTVTETARAMLAEQEHSYLGAGELPPGGDEEHPFSFTVPQGATPTYQGDILRVRWLVRAELELDGAPDAHAEAELTVWQAPAGPYPEPRHGGGVEELDECGLSVSVEGSAVRAGEPMCGCIRLEPQEGFDAQETRVELHRVELVPAREGNESSERVAEERVAGPMELYAGLPVDLPFQLRAPEGLRPSVGTPHAAAYWELEVVVARAWRPDLRTRRTVHVYTLPQSPGSAPDA
jgi:hypothetical protein